MMAQGAAGVLAAAALVVPYASLFVPRHVCQVLPPSVQHMLASIGTCSSSAYHKALTLPALSAAVTLIVATMLLICLLLHGVIVLLQQECSGVRRVSKWTGISILAIGISGLLLWLVCAAVWTLLEFLPARPGRLLLLMYWMSLLAVTLPALRAWASHSRVPQVSPDCFDCKQLLGVDTVRVPNSFAFLLVKATRKTAKHTAFGCSSDEAPCNGSICLVSGFNV